MEKITVIYNDSCPICAHEIGVYRKEAAENELDVAFEGLTDKDLSAYGLDEDTAARRLHVVSDGTRLAGIDAFIAIWRRLPRWTWLANIVDRPVIRPIAAFAYDRIAAPIIYGLHRRRQRRQSLETRRT
ncbi:MAG: DUF393 domain-containing protein [Pseudomonadota bacterium]